MTKGKPEDIWFYQLQQDVYAEAIEQCIRCLQRQSHMTQDLLWTSENAATLTRLRMEKGLDAFQVARMANLSSHHVNELESLEPLTERSHFYSEEIKAQIGHRLLALLQKWVNPRLKQGCAILELKEG